MTKGKLPGKLFHVKTSHAYQVTLHISGSPIDFFQWDSQKYPG